MKRSKLINGLLWAGFGIFAGLYILLGFLPIGETLRDNIQYIMYMVPILCAAGGTVYAYFRVTPGEKRFWLFLAFSVILLGLAEAYWIVFGVFNQVVEPPHPSFFDYVTLLAYFALFMVPISMVRFSKTFYVTKVRYLVDSLIVVLFAAIAIWTIVVGPAIARGEFTVLGEKFISIVYPIIDIGLVFAVVANVMGFKLSKWRPWEGMVAFGILWLAVADTMFAYASLNGGYGSNLFFSSIIDFLWMSMYFLFFMAAVGRLQQHRELKMPQSINITERASSKLQEVVVYLLVMATMPFFIMMSANTLVYNRWVMIIFGAILGFLIVIRAVLVVSENDRLFSHAVTDVVTGVYNYRFFQQRMQIELERATRYKGIVSLAFIDLDNFAQINNMHGHSVGDQLLHLIGQGMQDQVRLSDTVCRIGGDEFALIMPETHPLEALQLCLRLKEDIKAVIVRSGIDVTFTAGVASFPVHGITKEELEKRTDEALFWAKFHGKNQVILFDAKIIDGLNPQQRVEKAEELAYLNTVHALAAAVDARDAATQFHSKNVASLAVLLAEALGFDPPRIKLIETAALLHDVGKIGIPDSILTKPGRLTEDQRRQIEEHPELSRKILAATSLQEILPWISAHHERWDGMGYPRGLKGEDIPVEARLMAICDSYDAMVSDRPYRKGLSYTAALTELVKGQGTQFDPELVDVFIGLLDRMETHRMASNGR